ncbi:MAG: PEP-CTERM sorting domain-containing protein [Pirellulales bacterium]|nr:PEP-CTERM sorting domain-containing protein [Pirellulales bacterium]
MMHSNCLPRICTCLVCAVVLGFAGAAVAQTNWAGGTSTDWSNAANWDNGVPDSATAAVVNHYVLNPYDPVLDADGAAASLTMGTTDNASLTINANHALTITGGGFIGQMTGTTSTIVQSDGTLTADQLWLGSQVAGSTGAGTYNLSGGTLAITGGQGIIIGEQGHGTFTQTGGVVNNALVVYAGDNYVGQPTSYPGGTGEIAISGGVFNGGAYGVILGVWGGNASLTVNGTGVLNTNILSMAHPGGVAPGATTSTINLSGDGQINLGSQLLLAAHADTTGTLTQTGGVLTVPLLDRGLGMGTYDLTGGTLNVSEVRGMDLDNNGGTVNVGGAGIGSLVMQKDNIALGKSATQVVDPNWGFPASNGVDGNYNNFTHCDGTSLNNYWQVDLTGGDANVPVSEINLYARTDGGGAYANFMSNFFVRLIDKDGVVTTLGPFITTPEEYLAPGVPFEVPLGGTYDARYVKVQLDGYSVSGYGYLCVAEAEVLGDRYGYAQNADSTLGVELDPLANACDKLVAGAVSLAGTLDVTSLGGDFADGQVFDVLDWDTLAGTFDDVNLPTLTGGLNWDTSDLYVSGELRVVPEPSTIGLLLMGVIGLLATARRR